MGRCILSQDPWRMLPAELKEMIWDCMIGSVKYRERRGVRSAKMLERYSVWKRQQESGKSAPGDAFNYLFNFD